jgi:hypothetical protein
MPPAYRLYTFGGTGNLSVALGKTAVDPTYSTASVDYSQAGYGAQIAQGVNPRQVEWVPVAYAAAAYPMNVSVATAVNRTVSMILANPGKIFLAGTSQGAYVTSQLWREFTTGRLVSRRADLVRIYHYGNPLRQAKMFRGTRNPGGHGCAAANLRLTNTDPAVVWEFANPGDPVAIQFDDQKGTWAASFFGILNQNATSVSTLAAQISTLLLKPNANLSTLVSLINDLINNMLNQTGKHNAYQNFFPFGGTKSSVQLAIDDIATIVGAPSSKTRHYIAIPPALSVDDLTKTCTGIKNLNIGSVRIPVPWGAAQTSATTFAWTPFDQAVNAALTAGLRILLVIAPTRPEWATVATSNLSFGTFAAAVVSRYRPGGTGVIASNAGKGAEEYQVWDEPNVIENLTTGDNPTASGYVAYLREAYVAIKREQPTATVVFAGLQACTTQTIAAARRVSRAALTTSANIDPVTFLTDCYAAGAKPFFDVMAYHPLSMATRQKPQPPAPSVNLIAQSDSINALMVAKGDGTKPMYWTQVGYNTALITQTQQQAYLDTMRWLAHERTYVTGMVVSGYRDF